MTTSAPDPASSTGDDLFEVPAGLSCPDPGALEVLAARLRALQTGPGEGDWRCGDGMLTCDGGALALALVADELEIPVRLCVGLYWHTDPVLRAELMGDYPDGDDDPQWPQHLAWVARNAMDEHHHWVVLWHDSATPVLADPNGPVRGEPYLQAALPPAYGPDLWARYTYSELPVDDPDRVLMYDPDESWVDIASSMYPGLAATLAASLKTS